MTGGTVGVDIVQIQRFREKLKDSKFLERIFSKRELEDAGDGPGRAARLAARWAAKEATAKALGCGLGSELTWSDVEIRRNDRGQPELHMSDKANARFGYPASSVSLSHDGDYAIAVVIMNAGDKA